MPKLSRRDWFRWVLPLASLKMLATLSSQLSILNVPISYTHTVKVGVPG